MTPSEQIDALARAYFDKLHEGDCSPPYDALNDARRERHRRAVRALLLEQMRIAEASTDGLLAFVRPTAAESFEPGQYKRARGVAPPERERLVDRLTRRSSVEVA